MYNEENKLNWPWLPYQPNQNHSHFSNPHNFGKIVWISYSLSEMKMLVFMTWSYAVYFPQFMLIIEPIMSTNTHTNAYFKYYFETYVFSIFIKYHFKIGVWWTLSNWIRHVYLTWSHFIVWAFSDKIKFLLCVLRLKYI